MEANCTNLTERILDLTLEIIYLLTGEDNIVVKKTSGNGQNPIMVPLLSLPITERNNEQKILQVTQKIIDLLMRESGSWNKFNVRIKEEIKEREEEDGVMKDWKCLERHKYLYKDFKMESQPPLTSPDGSSNGNPPERCSRPLYSWDSTQEDHTNHHHRQGEERMGLKFEIKEEEEMYVIDNQLSIIEGELMETMTKEESSLDASTGDHRSWNNPEGCLILSADYNEEDIGMALYSPRKTIVTKNFHHKLNPMNCENPFRKYHDLDVHQRIPTSEKPFKCSECEKSFMRKAGLVQHLRLHTGEKLFSCSICGKTFTEKSQLNRHNIVHTGEKPFSCPECGRCFPHRGNRDKHMRIHTGERPFSCSECGKCFAQKSTLIIHQRMHTT